MNLNHKLSASFFFNIKIHMTQKMMIDIPSCIVAETAHDFNLKSWVVATSNHKAKN